MKIEATVVSLCLQNELNNDTCCGFIRSILMNYWEMPVQVNTFGILPVIRESEVTLECNENNTGYGTNFLKIRKLTCKSLEFAV